MDPTPNERNAWNAMETFWLTATEDLRIVRDATMSVLAAWKEAGETASAAAYNAQLAFEQKRLNELHK